MNDPWQSLQLAAQDALELIWYGFAKQGRESDVLAPLGQYPSAAAWLAESMGKSDNWMARKVAAMLAGWINDPRHTSILTEMLGVERKVFATDSLTANSVGEDIMVAATRWTESQNDQVRSAGIHVLAAMIRDALEGTPWNTVNWATANLYRATSGNHEILTRLIGIADTEIQGQQFLLKAVKALRQSDMATLNRLVYVPSRQQPLSSDDPNFSMVNTLWKATAAAEAAL